MKPLLHDRLASLASILDGIACLHEAAYPETLEDKKERVVDIQASLKAKGWKPSIIYGYHLDLNKERAWLTFSVDQVAIGTSLKKREVIDFGIEPAEPLAVHIDTAARKLLGVEPEKAKETYTTILAKIFESFGWKVEVEGKVIRAIKPVPDSTLGSLVSITYETSSGRANFAYFPQGKNPIQILSWKIEDYISLSPAAVVSKLSTLYEGILLKVAKLEKKEEISIEHDREQKIEEEEYLKWKALQDKKTKKKDQTDWFKERYEWERTK